MAWVRMWMSHLLCDFLKFLSLSVPQFLDIYYEASGSTYLIRML